MTISKAMMLVAAGFSMSVLAGCATHSGDDKGKTEPAVVTSGEKQAPPAPQDPALKNTIKVVQPWGLPQK